MKQKLWQKKTALHPDIEAYTVGDDPQLDGRLVQYDCLASISHARMLKKAGILTEEEMTALIEALDAIIEEDSEGKFEIPQHLEDCHTAIENNLTEKLGDLGKKIHTARSRNDQVLGALRLYYKDELEACTEEIVAVIDQLSAFMKQFGSVQFPGFTHTRKAMVASMGMWAGCYQDALQDNLLLVDAAFEIIDQSPLGTGAGYGIPLDIDRQVIADALEFSRIQENPMYVQHSRGKFEATLVHLLSQIMFDLNRMATDLILFSMPDMGFFILPEAFCTGSSIMPQKKNPDVFELMRAKYHEVVSHEMRLKSMTSNLIFGYHRDYQLTKKPVMESFDITRQSLRIMALVVEGLSIDADRCQAALTSEVYATEKAYDLVKKGMTFRDAYRTIAKEYE